MSADIILKAENLYFSYDDDNSHSLSPKNTCNRSRKRSQNLQSFPNSLAGTNSSY